MKKIAAFSFAALVMFAFTYAAHSEIDNMNIGGDIMMEYFYANDMDLNSSHGSLSETDFFRTEAHLWFQADLDDNITARISLEVDRALNQTSIGDMNQLRNGPSFGNLGVYLEEAFIKVADIGGTGFSLSAGRQFLNYGDDPLADNFNKWWGPGFIIADSNTNSPLLLTHLGSYEIDPFDAIVLSYETEQARVDVIHARDVEDFYNVSNNSTIGNNDASLWAIYGSYFGIEGHQLDLYFTYNDDNTQITPGSLGVSHDKRFIVGGRAAGDISEQLAYKAEVAYQFEDPNKVIKPPAGTYDKVDALGAQGGLNYHPDMEYNPNIGIIYTFLEQDNNNKAGAFSQTGFSAPFEGKTYGLLFEGLAKTTFPLNGRFFTNMHVFNLNGGLEPMEKVAWTVDFYYYLLEKEVPLTPTVNKDDGGFEVDTQLDYQFNDNLTTFLGGGVYIPGNVFDNNVVNLDDPAYFFRAGMKVHF